MVVVLILILILILTVLWFVIAVVVDRTLTEDTPAMLVNQR